MTDVLPSAQLFLLAWLFFTAVGSALSAIVVRFLGRQVLACPPAARHRALVLLSALPVLLAAALMLSATLPSLLAIEGAGIDHCVVHDDAHPHLCFVHHPHVGMNVVMAGVVAMIVAYTVVRAVRASARMGRAVRVLGALTRSGEHRADLAATVLETSQPLCLAAGLWRPRILLSRGLLDVLASDQRAIMLAHETAHINRRDGLTNALARFLAAAHLPKTRRWLESELVIAAEQACDEAAGVMVGDRLAVASAILSVKRAGVHSLLAQLSPVTVAFGESALERRVESLLADPLPHRSLVWFFSVFGAGTAGLLLLSGRVHHAVESLLFLIAY